jgi:hypothetical protein
MMEPTEIPVKTLVGVARATKGTENTRGPDKRPAAAGRFLRTRTAPRGTIRAGFSVEFQGFEATTSSGSTGGLLRNTL